MLCLLLALVRPLYAQAVFEGNAWEDFPGGAKAVCANDDIDDDNDGLIELCYLEDVDAMRHVLDGSGYQFPTTTNKVTTGCPLVEGSETCKGYELVRNLDFNDDDSYISAATNKATWTTASGWRTIEGLFTAALEGNGHTLSNLYISRTAEQRDETGFLQNNQGYIRNFGLADVNVSLTRSSLNRARGGILVVVNAGSIMNCYITGKADYKYIVIDNIPASVHSAGVASLNQGKISNVYMDMSVKWARRVGLFVNVNRGEIANSYARGTINKVGFSFAVGFVYENNGSEAIINNVYYAVAASGSGPIATYNNDAALISNSYWDSVKWQSNLSDAALQSRGRATTQGSRGFTTSKLQKPLAPGKSKGNPYFEWREENWDFGTRREYPAIKHAPGDDADNPACGISQQPECDALLQGQGRNNQPRIIAPQDNDEILITKRDADTSKTIGVTVSDLDVGDELTLLLSAVDEDQNLVTLETTKAQVLPNGKSKRGINEELSIRVPQEIISGMTTLRLLAKDNNVLGSTVSDPISLKVTAIDNTQPTVAPIADIVLLEGANTTLNMVIKDADSDLLSVRLDSSDSTVATATITATSGANRTLEIAALDEGMTTITVTVNDGREEINSTATETFTVEVAANEAPTLSITPTKQRLQLNDTAEITATVSDANFDLNDVITLTAMSSTSSVVSVAPPNIGGIVDAGSATFTITAHKGGDATITITATDNQGVKVSKTVSVHVNAPPTITIAPDLSALMLLEGTSETLRVTVTDDDNDFADHMVDVMSDDTTTATATLGEVDGTGYPLVITAIKVGTVPITVSVDDGGSRAAKTFEVTVVENQAPTLGIVTSPSPTIESGTTTSVVISIRDANFDVNDSVSLEARSSTASVVSVTPESISGIGSNTTKIFTLTGKRVGESEISFTATDSKVVHSTVSVLLSVYSSLAVTDNVPTEPIIVPLGEAFSLDTSTFFTYRGSDILSYAATGLPDETPFIFSTMTGVLSGTPQVAGGSTDKDSLFVTVTATDDSGGIAEAMFTLLINAEPSGTVAIGFDAATWQLTATSGVADANGIDETMTSYQWFKGETVVSTTDSNTYTIPNTNSGRDGGTEYRVDVTYVDNIEQSVTTSSDIYTVVNEAPVITSVMPTKSGYDEGERVSVTTNANDANHDDLTYTWRVNSGAASLNEFNRVSERATLSFNVPTDWIDDTSTRSDITKTLELEVAVSDGSLSTTKTAEVVVAKINNGVPTIRPLITRGDKRLTLRMSTDDRAIDADPDGAHDNPDKFYRWQWCQSPCSLWMDISDATTATYIIPDNISDTDVQDNDKFRIKIGYTDGQGYSETIFSGHRAASANADIKVRAKVFLEGPLQ